MDWDQLNERFQHQYQSGMVFVVCNVVCLVVLIVGAQLTGLSVETWYKEIAKPDWTPPNWVFPVVWPLLYFMIALAMWQLAQQAGFRAAVSAWVLIVAQLMLNVAWSGVFFGMQSIGTGFWIIFITVLLLFPTILLFAVFARWAALLLVPYLLWLCYATALNFAIWSMNEWVM